MERSASERTQIVLVILCVVLYLGHFLVFTWPQPFYIEDSGISFAYARNLVDGEGLVPFPGGERVEGYSNATWTFLIAALYAVGVPVWTSAKVLGAVFGSATLFFAWDLARRARPNRDDPLAVAAPFLLACSTQFVLWNASGLENSLFNLLLAAGMWSLTREIQDDRKRPWSSLLFALLTMTRPDGLAYAAIALFARLLGTIARRQWVALPLWIVGFAAIYAPYNAWRYDYFAWWYPNTYYAKERVFRPFLWTGGSWKQVKEYFTQYGIVYAAPLLAVALTGLRSWRRWVGVVLLAVLALFLLWDGRSGIPASWAGNWSRVLNKNWNDARVWYLLGAAAVMGLVTLGRRGWEARGMMWGSLCAGVFFCVWAQGDWMKGLRFFSQTSVPLFTTLAVGIGVLSARLPFASRKVAGWLPVQALYAVPMIVALGYPNINGSWSFANNPETAVRDVHKRVKYMTWVQNRLGLDHVTLLDVDMGAHLWYSGWDIVDIAGLIDVPISHHRKWQKEFTGDYIFDEKRPEFAHVHGAWAKTSKINSHPRWEEDYVEIPGFPTGKRALHVGNHVRKDLLAGKAYTGPADRRQAFEGDLTLEGWDVPSPTITPGGKLYISTTWNSPGRDAGFRVIAFLSDGTNITSAEVVPGYDWYKPTVWDAGDHVYGNWSIPVPESLPQGTYDLGFVLLDEKTGAVLRPTETVVVTEEELPIEVPVDADAVFMQGEWRPGVKVTVGPPNQALKAADGKYEDALAQAKSGDCEGALETFRNARRHVARNDKWYLSHVDAVETAAVECLVAQAGKQQDPYGKAKLLAQAHGLDHNNADFIAAADPLADALVAEGDKARDAEDWEGAYKAYAAALTFKPTLSWTRRAAEEMRDLRLGIDGQDGPPGKLPTKPSKTAKPAPAKVPVKPSVKKEPVQKEVVEPADEPAQAGGDGADAAEAGDQGGEE